MKNCKRYIAIALVLVICLSLCACISKNKAVGTWSDTYIYNGNEFFVTLILDADGNYTKVSYKNGSLHETLTGKWDIDGGEVCCYKTTGSVCYKYKGGKLVNGSQALEKQ